MNLKIVKLILIPIILLIGLFALQVNTQLTHILKLPAPGWSRPLNASVPLQSSSKPFIALKGNQLNIYTTTGNLVTRSSLTPNLKVTHQDTYSLKDPIHSVVWGKDNVFIYQKGDGLYLYKPNKTSKLASHFSQIAASESKVFYSDSFHLYEASPSIHPVEIAGFASPVNSISSIKDGSTLVVTTQNPTSHQVTFFLLKNVGEQGYTPLKLGYIQPKKGDVLKTVQLTKLKSSYFVLIAWQNKVGMTTLEHVQLSSYDVAQGTVQQPKAHPFSVQYNGKPLTKLQDLNLSSYNGKPVLLFLGDHADGLKNTLLEANEISGKWVAQTRSSAFLTKSQPFWGSSSQDLIGWLTPKLSNQSLIQFGSHLPELTKESLKVTRIDLVHAIQDTYKNSYPMCKFLLILFLYGLPTLLTYLVLLKWGINTWSSTNLYTASGIILLLSEIDVVHHVLTKAQNLPVFLLFPYSAISYVIGGAIISGLLVCWLCPKEWLFKVKLTYGLSVFFLSLTFIIGPYF